VNKIFAVAFIIVITALHSFSQDVIVLKNSGERIQAKIIEVGPAEIKYKDYDKQDGPIYIISKADVDMILYVDGSKDVFIEEPDNTDSTTTNAPNNGNAGNTTNTENTSPATKPEYTANLSNDDLFKQGQADAKKYYRGYHGAASSTYLVSMIGTPIAGLIPAIACSTTTPHGKYLMCPDPELLKNNEYYAGYILRAKRIKSRKIWTSWGVACSIYAFYVLLYSAY
jgi:hypothetical protein